MTVDFSPVVNALVGVAALVIPAIGVALTTMIYKHFGIQQNAAFATRLNTAIAAEAQGIVPQMTAAVDKYAQIDIKNAAVAKAAQNLEAGAQKAADTLGVTQATVAARIDGVVTGLMGGPTPTGAAPAQVVAADKP